MWIQIIIGFLLDCLFGDPHQFTHPVERIGTFIQWMETKCRTWAGGEKKREMKAGAILLLSTVGLTYILTFGFIWLVGRIHSLAAWGLSVFFIYRILAAKSLKTETMKVYKKLKEQDLEGARKELSYLVGRDTQELTEEEVIKATVETIAENTSDGVIAPLFYIALLGAPLGMAYKAVNTLDSMVGYRNEKYKHIGMWSAKCDDIVNYIPARIGAGLMILAAFLMGLNGRGAIKIFWRDRYQHLSPNSAQTEAVAAGALDLCLGGTHTYFGKPVVKPTIGDPIREAQVEDIRKTNRLMYGTTILMLLILGLFHFLLQIIGIS